MTIKRDDLIDNSTITFKKLKVLSDRVAYLRAQAARIDELSVALVNGIQNGNIQDTDQIDWAISWLNHSQLSAGEIFQKIL